MMPFICYKKKIRKLKKFNYGGDGKTEITLDRGTYGHFFKLGTSYYYMNLKQQKTFVLGEPMVKLL